MKESLLSNIVTVARDNMISTAPFVATIVFGLVSAVIHPRPTVLNETVLHCKQSGGTAAVQLTAEKLIVQVRSGRGWIRLF